MAAVTSCQSRPDAGAGKALRRDRRTPGLGRLQAGSGPLSLHPLEQKPPLDRQQQMKCGVTDAWSVCCDQRNAVICCAPQHMSRKESTRSPSHAQRSWNHIQVDSQQYGRICLVLGTEMQPQGATDTQIPWPASQFSSRRSPIEISVSSRCKHAFDIAFKYAVKYAFKNAFVCSQ